MLARIFFFMGSLIYSPSCVHLLCSFSFFFWIFFLTSPQITKLTVRTVKNEPKTLTLNKVPYCYELPLVLLGDFQLSKEQSSSNYPNFLLWYIYTHKLKIPNETEIPCPLGLNLLECLAPFEYASNPAVWPIHSLAFSVAKTRFVLLSVSQSVFKLTFFTIALGNISSCLAPYLNQLFKDFRVTDQYYLISCCNLLLVGVLSNFFYLSILPAILEFFYKRVFLFDQPAQTREIERQAAQRIRREMNRFRNFSSE